MKAALMFLQLLSLVILASCGGGKKGKLAFNDYYETANELKVEQQKTNDKYLQDKKDFAIEKIKVWKEINDEAKDSFADVRDIFNKKCISCHDINFKLPFYGNILTGINPVHKHQEDGLKALNFGNGFPFTAQGNPPPIALVKAIRNSVVERSMPIKVFTVVYPKKKINDEDEKRILAWADSVIQKFQDYETKYNTLDQKVDVRAKKILEMKCFRCHANGNARGGFGSMENYDSLLNGKYVSKDSPEDSKLFTIVRDGKMPPNKQDKLSAEEQYTIRDWIQSSSVHPLEK